MSVVEELDLEQVKTDAWERLEELRARRQRLALDATTDPKAAKELASVDADVQAAGQAFEHAELACEERKRRDAEDAVTAAAERRSAALSHSRELQRELLTRAEGIDERLAGLAEDLGAYHAAAAEQARELRAAGFSMTQALGVQAKPLQVGLAIRHALTAAKVPVTAVPLQQVPAAGGMFWGKPMVDLVPRFVEPVEGER